MNKIKKMDYLKKYHKSVMRSLAKLGKEIGMEISHIEVIKDGRKKAEIQTTFSEK